jgi:uncharacterized membrane protein
MSYIKPKLIEPKIAKLIAGKIEEKKTKYMFNNQIKEQEIIQNNIISEPFHKKILNYFLNFFKKNYVLLIILILIIILLFVRYIETKKRKEQLKELLEQVNNESIDE